VYIESEKTKILVAELEVGDKIDTDYFLSQTLPRIQENIDDISETEKENLANIQSFIDREELTLLQKIQEKTLKPLIIQIYQSSHFSGVIFLGFLLSFFFQDTFLTFISSLFFSF